MNAANDNTARKGLRGWWLSPPRPGPQRLINPWDYHHLRVFGVMRIAGGIVLAGIGVQHLVELNGAFSNPRLHLELPRLGALYSRLVEKAVAAPRTPRPVSPGRPPVLTAVSRVLDTADRPMRACEIHVEAEKLAGEPLLWTSVKAALAAGTTGPRPRFRRVAYGVYQAAR